MALTLSTMGFAPVTTSVPGTFHDISVLTKERRERDAYRDSRNRGDNRREDEKDKVLLELHVDLELEARG